MFAAINTALVCTKAKVDSWFRRVFKEQAGGAEVIATLIIVAVVLVLALAFRDNLSELVKSLWNNMTQTGENNQQVDIPEWN
jgi:Flp pilus assembly pilin Flp